MGIVRKTIAITDIMEEWIKSSIAEGSYANDSEYVRALIRKDIEDKGVANGIKAIKQGYKDYKEGRYFEGTGDYKQDQLIRKEKERNGWK